MKIYWLLLSLQLVITCNSRVYDTNTVPEGRLRALIFLSGNCPVSQKYINRLNELQQNYPSVAFIGIFSEKESRQEVAGFKAQNGIRFSIYRDKNGSWQKKLGATHTPQVFFISPENQILYKGAIDNWYYDLEQLQKAPTDHFLQNAIDSYLAKKPVFLKDTRPVGCRIEE